MVGLQGKLRSVASVAPCMLHDDYEAPAMYTIPTKAEENRTCKSLCETPCPWIVKEYKSAVRTLVTQPGS
jgi:hypothetical protein